MGIANVVYANVLKVLAELFVTVKILLFVQLQYLETNVVDMVFAIVMEFVLVPLVGLVLIVILLYLVMVVLVIIVLNHWILNIQLKIFAYGALNLKLVLILNHLVKYVN